MLTLATQSTVKLAGELTPACMASGNLGYTAS